MIPIIEELKQIGMNNYFKTTTLGENWFETIEINKVCNNVPTDKEL